jgi:hypothetical protein
MYQFVGVPLRHVATRPSFRTIGFSARERRDQRWPMVPRRRVDSRQGTRCRSVGPFGGRPNRRFARLRRTVEGSTTCCTSIRGIGRPLSIHRRHRQARTGTRASSSTGRDRLISELEASDFAARLRESGGHVEERVFGRASHATLIGAVAPALRAVGPVLSDVDDFLSRL